MNIFFSLIALGCVTVLATAQTTTTSRTSEAGKIAGDTLNLEFRQLAEKWRQAYNGKDAKMFEQMYTSDAEYISAHVAGYVAHGRDRIIANFQNGAQNGGYIDTVEVLSVNSSCDMATLVTRYVGIAGGRKVNGRNLLVCERTKDDWLIVTHMTVVRD